jgi:hypothetical protein
MLINTLPKRHEHRIRRVLELSLIGFGIASLAYSIYHFSIVDIAVSLLVIHTGFRKAVEDLPRYGALVNKRPFWGQ